MKTMQNRNDNLRPTWIIDHVHHMYSPLILAAAMLDIPEKRLEQLVSQGKIDYLSINGVIRVPVNMVKYSKELSILNDVEKEKRGVAYENAIQYLHLHAFDKPENSVPGEYIDGWIWK